jgi:hypothetical protein
LPKLYDNIKSTPSELYPRSFQSYFSKDKKDHDFYQDGFGRVCKTDADVIRVAEGVILKFMNVWLIS